MTIHVRKRGVSAQVQISMIIRELTGSAAPELLSQRFEGGAATPGGLSVGNWCPNMARKGDHPAQRQSGSVAAEPVCGKLRVLFDVADEPMPESLMSLADRLDAAFARGDLSADAPGNGPAKGSAKRSAR